MIPTPRYYLFNAEQDLLAVFGDAEQAHQSAHDASRVPHARLPLEVTHPAARTSRLFWPDRCQTIRWMAPERAASCTVRSGAHPAGSARPAPSHTGAPLAAGAR